MEKMTFREALEGVQALNRQFRAAARLQEILEVVVTAENRCREMEEACAKKQNEVWALQAKATSLAQDIILKQERAANLETEIGNMVGAARTQADTEITRIRAEKEAAVQAITQQLEHRLFQSRQDLEAQILQNEQALSRAAENHEVAMGLMRTEESSLQESMDRLKVELDTLREKVRALL